MGIVTGDLSTVRVAREVAEQVNRLGDLRFLFDLGEAILPSQSNCAAVSNGGHPKGLSLTAVSTVAGFGAPGEKAIITACGFPLPLPMYPTAFGKWTAGSPSKKPFSRLHQKAA
jgi:hypothetical protein